MSTFGTDRINTDFLRDFCFESQEKDSLILNYSSLSILLRTRTQDDIVAAIEQLVKDHMQRNGRAEFVFHLFCTGMHMKGIHIHRNFIFRVTHMFRNTFPKELNACYVHDAPFIFSQVFEIIKPFLNKSMRRRIIIIKNSANEGRFSSTPISSKNRNITNTRYARHSFQTGDCQGASNGVSSGSDGTRARVCTSTDSEC